MEHSKRFLEKSIDNSKTFSYYLDLRIGSELGALSSKEVILNLHCYYNKFPMPRIGQGGRKKTH